LPEDFARIHLVDNQMYSAAVLGVASCKRALMRARTRIFRQERRMDVDQPASPLLYEIGSQDAHEAGQRDKLDVTLS
jgi:hypothetical protein